MIAKMQFVLTGFTQEVGFRVFAFARVEAGAIRIPFTVRADMALVRRYAIPMQELPLLCRGILEIAGAPEQLRQLEL